MATCSASHPLHHLLDQEGRAVEGEVPAHPEGELRFRDPHVERPGRNAGPVPIQLALEEPARKRPVDPDVGLARLARRGDLQPTVPEPLRSATARWIA